MWSSDTLESTRCRFLEDTSELLRHDFDQEVEETFWIVLLTDSQIGPLKRPYSVGRQAVHSPNPDSSILQ